MLVEKEELSAVRLSHYVAGHSESPMHSLDEFDACKSSTCSVVSLYSSRVSKIKTRYKDSGLTSVT